MVIRDKARVNVARGVPKQWTLKRRQRTCQDGSNRIRNQGSRQRLHLGSRTTCNKTFRKAVELEIAK
jgi:hypothetical protein